MALNDKDRTVTELLTEAREFIAEPSRWCQGQMGLDRFDRPVPGGNLLYAERCCGIGAVARVARRRGMDGFAPVFLHLTAVLDGCAIELYPQSDRRQAVCPAAYVNDKLGHAAILRVYDAAIAASQEVTA